MPKSPAAVAPPPAAEPAAPAAVAAPPAPTVEAPSSHGAAGDCRSPRLPLPRPRYRAAPAGQAAARGQYTCRAAEAPAAPAKPAAHKPPQAGSARPPASGQPSAPPARRMIVPQTGPRPVYTAPPPPPPRAPQPPQQAWVIAPACRCVGSLSSSVRVPDSLLPPVLLARLGHPVLRARVRHSVQASAVPCTPPAPLRLRADVRPWAPDVPAWGRVRVVRRVRAVCSALLPVLRLRVPLRDLARAPVRPLAAPASVIPARAASRKGR